MIRRDLSRVDVDHKEVTGIGSKSSSLRGMQTRAMLRRCHRRTRVDVTNESSRKPWQGRRTQGHHTAGGAADGNCFREQG